VVDDDDHTGDSQDSRLRPVRMAIRRAAIPVAFLAIALPAGIGVVMAMGDHDKPAAEESAFRSISGEKVRFARRAEPRWERVATFTGQGAATRSFAIAPRAIQWKADWACHAGAFEMTVGEAAGDARLVTTESCPDVGVQTATGKGAGRMQVTAGGSWRVVVSQQVDTALEEPPLPGMSAATELARGRFHRIQNDGRGMVALHRLPSGRLALRFESFYTSASPGLRVWLSNRSNVTSTLQARQSRHADVGALRSTLGSYNQMLPRDIDAAEFRTIVIWCPTVLIAFAAAPLQA
jgi:hypothetical protein